MNLSRPYLRQVLERRGYTFTFSTLASSVTWKRGGVSMVQGASRGIGLEFVSLPLFCDPFKFGEKYATDEVQPVQTVITNFWTLFNLSYISRHAITD
ncbi:hypothetical protein FXO37_36620 [Capsicum annuum]|nr:hypothetical protein FXO37_36620 [Capsicum annuum]